MIGLEIMKNVARLVLFFTSSFAAVLVLTALVRFLQIRIDTIRFLPPQDGQIGQGLFSAIQWALPASLYISLLFSLSYTVRRRVFAPAAMICLFILGTAFSLGVTVGAEGVSRLAKYLAPAKVLGNPGLILTQADNAMVLVQDPAEAWGGRVVSIPGRSLLYQEVPRGPDNAPIVLPPIPFRTASEAWVLQSFSIDFSLASRELLSRFSQGLLPFLIYTGALVFFLVSLRFIMGLSKWPLANLFLGALVFRGILIMEIFLNSLEVQDVLNTFVGETVPISYFTPLIFVFLGFLVCLYTFLSYLAHKKDSL
jgi:hypothetical protein